MHTAITCEEELFIDNGSFREVQDSYVVGDRVTFSCDDGFNLEGPNEITCQADSEWSDRFPTCQRKFTIVRGCNDRAMNILAFWLERKVSVFESFK